MAILLRSEGLCASKASASNARGSICEGTQMVDRLWAVRPLSRHWPAPRDRMQFFRKEDDMKRARALLLVFVLCATVGCANMTPQQQRALSGGAIGAAGGAAVGAIVGGSPALGAVVGGAVGTAAGALWGDINRALK